MEPVQVSARACDFLFNNGVIVLNSRYESHPSVWKVRFNNYIRVGFDTDVFPFLKPADHWSTRKTLITNEQMVRLLVDTELEFIDREFIKSLFGPEGLLPETSVV